MQGVFTIVRHDSHYRTEDAEEGITEPGKIPSDAHFLVPLEALKNPFYTIVEPPLHDNGALLHDRG